MNQCIMALCCLLVLAAPCSFAQNPVPEIQGDYLDAPEYAPDPALESFFALENNLEELGRTALEDHTGQFGVQIDISLEVTGGYLAWKDPDGYSQDGEPGIPGCITFSGMRMNDGNDPIGPIIINNLVINTGYNSRFSYMTIALPNVIGRVSFDDVKLGTAVDQGESMGGLVFGDLNIRKSNFLIRAR